MSQDETIQRLQRMRDYQFALSRSAMLQHDVKEADERMKDITALEAALSALSALAGSSPAPEPDTELDRLLHEPGKATP